MRESAADLARRLAQNAEAVCREYLSNGRREGHTWRVGDADNTPGRSLAVRLTGPDSGNGAAGKWTDFATGENGDLLDLIARSRRFDAFRDVAEEARRFLSLPETVSTRRQPPAPTGSPEAARRLFASARPIHGTIAETYLRNRGITDLRGVKALRFHPNCFYRAHEDAPRETWPALIAAVTDLQGAITGVLRTWLKRDGSHKAPLATPRRAMGHLLGNGVRFGVAKHVVAAGEGLETMLSLHCVLPGMPMIAALSAHLLDELALYGHRPHDDEPDPRPLPEPARLQGALADMFDALVATLSDTRLEPDLQTLLWSVVNMFHRRIDRIERDLDTNETAQRAGQRDQDGSEIRSLELERLIAQGLTLIERRNSFEFVRDTAAELYGVHTGQIWRPRTGSIVNHTTLTAAMIDSREFINARRRADAQVLLPRGARIAFAGGVDCNDHHRIWAVLDKVMAKHSDMILLHGGTPRGAEKIAACWADARKVPQVVFKPEWTRHQKAAPFKRNDQLLEALPIGVIVFPGSGVTDNLADKARTFGIPLFDFRKSGGA